MRSLSQFALILVLAVLPVGRAAAQQGSGSSPTLPVTMQFIQGKLNGLGQVNYAAYNHDNADGQNWTTQFTTLDTNVVADPSNCRISYHEKRTKDGAVTADADYYFGLGSIQEVITEPREQLLKKVNTANGHPTWDARIDPPMTMLIARKDENTEWYFYFTDGELAGRVANAMNHALTLCGGGKKEPF
jgi:hypothetical protein